MSKRFSVVVYDATDPEYKRQVGVVGSVNESVRYGLFTADELRHVCDCITVGNEYPPDDIPEEHRDAAHAFQCDLNEIINDAS